MKASNSHIRRLVALGVVVTAVAAVFAGQASAAVSILSTVQGSPGAWVALKNAAGCSGRGDVTYYTATDGTVYPVGSSTAPSISTVGVAVTTSPLHWKSAQTVWMLPVVYVSKDGRSWAQMSGLAWESRSAAAGQITPVTFAPQNVDVSNLVSQGYHYFKYFELFEWDVNGLAVGRVTDGATYSDFASGSQLGEGASLYNTNDSNSPVGCYIP